MLALYRLLHLNAAAFYKTARGMQEEGSAQRLQFRQTQSRIYTYLFSYSRTRRNINSSQYFTQQAHSSPMLNMQLKLKTYYKSVP